MSRDCARWSTMVCGKRPEPPHDPLYWQARHGHIARDKLLTPFHTPQHPAPPTRPQPNPLPPLPVHNPTPCPRYPSTTQHPVPAVLAPGRPTSLAAPPASAPARSTGQPGMVGGPRSTASTPSLRHRSREARRSACRHPRSTGEAGIACMRGSSMMRTTLIKYEY